MPWHLGWELNSRSFGNPNQHLDLRRYRHHRLSNNLRLLSASLSIVLLMLTPNACVLSRCKRQLVRLLAFLL